MGSEDFRVVQNLIINSLRHLPEKLTWRLMFFEAEVSQ